MEEQRDEALFLVDDAAYLHVWATDDSRNYTRDGCYTTYSYTYYDKATHHEIESGDMEVFDMWDDLQQDLLSAAGNILSCRLVTERGEMEAVSLDMLKSLRTPMPDVEQVIASMRDETIREIGKETISAAAQMAWYWSYIGALDMAQQLGLINDSRRQALYHEAEKFKPVCEVKAVQPGDHLAAVETNVEQNSSQINSKAPKPSVLGTLRQCQEDAGKSQEGTAPPGRDPER